MFGFQTTPNTYLLSGQNEEVEKLKEELNDCNTIIVQSKKTLAEISEENLRLEEDKNLAWEKAEERDVKINKLNEQIKQMQKQIDTANAIHKTNVDLYKNLQLAQDRATASDDQKEKFKLENEDLKKLIEKLEFDLKWAISEVSYLNTREQNVSAVYKQNIKLENFVEELKDVIIELKEKLKTHTKNYQISAKPHTQSINENPNIQTPIIIIK